MPEGPEIRLAADRLNTILANQTIEHAEFTLPGMQSAATRIIGEKVKGVTCHGKALLTQFAHGETLYSHNQLYGVWRTTERGKLPKTNRTLRVGLHTTRHSAFLYSATDVELWPTDHLYQHPFLKKLGPDVLDSTISVNNIVERLQDKRFRRRSLGSLYLDQTFIAGIGNYLRSEILFKAKVFPQSKPNDLSLHDLRRLARATLTVSQRSYQTRGVTVTKATSKRLARLGGDFESHRFAVFGRANLACIDCGTVIGRTQISGRRLYWCPACQKS